MLMVGENDKMKEMVYLPLGGVHEIGMNMGLYGYGNPDQEKWIMIDCGITFGDPNYPGVEIMSAKPDFIIRELENLEAIVITHAHEDHIGGLPYLWHLFKKEIYATPFAMNVIKSKFDDIKMLDVVRPYLREVPLRGTVSIGDFKVTYISVAHSILESNSLVIETPVGKAVHTGDWKLDDNPVLGSSTDLQVFKKLEAIDTVVCDSTNVLSDEESGSEGNIEENIYKVVKNHDKRLLITFFASNVARLKTIESIARRTNRKLILIGRSMWRMYEAALNSGYLKGFTTPLDIKEAGSLPTSKTLIACTGSQGETNAALYRMANNRHPQLKLDSGDMVMFSSRIIPGNNKGVYDLYNSLVRKGVVIIKPDDAEIHVSGHPSRTEVKKLYDAIKPKAVLPVHGEYIHLDANKNLAEEMGLKSLVAKNGDIVRIAPGIEIVDRLPNSYIGRMGLEGNRMLPIDSEVMNSRKRALYKGALTVSFAINSNSGNLASGLVMSDVGIFDYNHDYSIINDLQRKLLFNIKNYSPELCLSKKDLQHSIRVFIRSFLHQRLNLRPSVDLHILYIR